MQIVIVNSPKLAKQFIKCQPRFYKNDPNYIRPWDHDIEHVFSEKKNKWFRQGKAERWLLFDHDKNIIGRIAAFVHPKLERKTEPTGGCGFFECINDQVAANLLFDTARDWLKGQDKMMMDGPINFGEKDKWWGCLIEGFDPPLYGMNYNPPFYKDLMETYGFQDYFQQYVFRYDLSQPAPQKFKKASERLKAKNDGFRFEHVNKKNLDKYAEDFRTIYNEAWGKGFKGHTPMRSDQTKMLMKSLKPIMLEEALIFGYHYDRPIAFFLNIPNLNPVIKKLNGKFTLFHKLKFLYLLKVAKSYKTLSGVIFGVVPDYQGLGVDGALAVRGEELLVTPGKFTYLELMWIGDFNPKMLSIAISLNAKKSRTYITYRYMFDQTAEFKRHPVVNK